MALTSEEIQKALKIKKVVTKFFERTNLSKVQAKELMPDLINNGIFPSNHQDGFPIRDFLRKLDGEKHLHLIPQIFFEQKDKNKNWFFKSIESNGLVLHNHAFPTTGIMMIDE